MKIKCKKLKLRGFLVSFSAVNPCEARSQEPEGRISGDQVIRVQVIRGTGYQEREVRSQKSEYGAVFYAGRIKRSQESGVRIQNMELYLILDKFSRGLGFSWGDYKKG